MENTEFKTGEMVLATDCYPVSPSSTRMRYLCTISSEKHLCVRPWEWDDDDFHSVTEYKFIDKLKIVFKVKKASDIIKWLEANEYKVTVQGSWMPTKKDMLIFSRNMFVECGKDFDLVKRPKRFMKEWLAECNNCG